MTNAKNGISSIKTVGTFIKTGTCSEALCNVLDRAFGHPLKIEEHASMPLAGGIMQHGYQCGLIWGATLAAGAQAYRLFGPGPQAETGAVIAAQRLVESFCARNSSINCLELTDTQWQKPKQMLKYFIKGGTIRCFSMATKFAPAAFGVINTAFFEKHIPAPSPPVSCSAMLARKMGVSEMHQVMAAGFAGGIGMSGGACGALGAAIWIIGMNSSRHGTGKMVFKSPGAMDAVDRFMKCTGFEFECSKITGQKFKNIGDHAGYLGDGGCSKIIEVLAAESP